jgi:ADP-ribosylglycohydrolase
MLGSIFGDIVGAVYERPLHKAAVDFELFHSHAKFTDDTVLTVATAEALMNTKDFKEAYLKWGRKFPLAGYSKGFMEWLASSNPQPYNSHGNGSAMRVAPIGWIASSLTETLDLAKKSAKVTHNHPDGIKGAQAVASSVFLARKGFTKSEIRSYVTVTFGYDLTYSLEEISVGYRFDMSCEGSVPQALICFLASSSTEDAVRKAVLLNGDTDTQAAIAGGIAEAFYRDLAIYKNKIKSFLHPEMLSVLEKFEETYV